MVKKKLRKLLLIFTLLNSFICLSQKDTSKYNRKDEILYNEKRYAMHNNYLTFGGGICGSNLRDAEQRVLGADFTFHIMRQHFQIGFLMSGDAFLNNNNLSGHFGYCYRIEDERRNIAFTGGISQNKGQIPSYIDFNGDTIPAFFYRNTGIYLSASYVKKLTFDIGIGVEAFTELNQTQQMYGLKAILFFSGSYRGKSKMFNRYVKKRY